MAPTMKSFAAFSGENPSTLRDREGIQNVSGQHDSSTHRGNVKNNTNGESGATGRMAGTSRHGDESRLELERALIGTANAVATAPRLASTVHEDHSVRRVRQRASDSDDEEETPDEVARRVAEAEERRSQHEQVEAARIQAINDERAVRGLRPVRAAATDGESQRRELLHRDAKLGRVLDDHMGTSLGYEYLTKDGKMRTEFK